nr:MAG: major capsid protein [Army ant associated microvirus 13]
MKRSKFSLSNTHLMSYDMGWLGVANWFEVLPGDTVQQATSALVRASPLLAPVMHPTEVYLHHWFVPNRLIWANWDNFITGGADGKDATVWPHIDLTSVAKGSLADHLGISPFSASQAVSFSALPFRAYQMIYDKFYRDEDLSHVVTYSDLNGLDTTTATNMAHVTWQKDYFTTARPWEMKGDAVVVPVGGMAPVVPIKTSPFTIGWKAFKSGQAALNPTGIGYNSQGTVTGDGGASLGLDPNGLLQADLGQATGLSVNALRTALAMQRFEEARARYGSRYVEYLRYLGVKSSDARLQLPEYLGGGRQTIQFSEVLQTAGGQGGATDSVGSLKGHGMGAARTNRYRRFFEEHGIVMTMMFIRPRTIYAGGAHRGWFRNSRYMYWQPEFQHTGQQQILNKELYLNSSSPDGVFGYQDRYDEYRHNYSVISGDFNDTLNYWHMARNFTAEPVLNESFVACYPTERIFAANTSSGADTMYVMVSNSIQARRLLASKGSSFTS